MEQSEYVWSGFLSSQPICYILPDLPNDTEIIIHKWHVDSLKKREVGLKREREVYESKRVRVRFFFGSVTLHFKAHRWGLRTKTSGIKGWRRELSVLVITIQQKD